MEHLPLELVFRIIHLTLERDFDPDATRPTKPRQAWCLALVCKQWRDIVESRTFGTITLKSSDLDAFAEIYGSQLRRASLHTLNILLDIPGCVDAAAPRTTSRAMRATTRRHNSEAFTKILKDWFTTLGSWPYNPARDRTITLAISGPSHNRPLEKVQLPAPDTIPRVHRITSLNCSDTTIN
jgi:hypothetical protein